MVYGYLWQIVCAGYHDICYTLHLGMYNEQSKKLKLCYFWGLCKMCLNMQKGMRGWGGVGSQCGYGANVHLVKKIFFEIENRKRKTKF